MNFAIKKLLNS